jgi:hypothetical protein
MDNRIAARTTRRVSLGVVPVQNRVMPSSVNIRYAQWNALRYCVRASNDCILVLTTLQVASQQLHHDQEGVSYSSGIVVYTVIRPAIAPIANVRLVGKDWPGRVFPCTNCFKVAYEVNRTAEFAPCLAICWIV